ncbi:MAG: TrbG/VirB9 family P-type conjugative transfer protein [Bdellovibrionales bacterium]|nr:TrbG/VirB9 family P-type conjugative transfer protein [Bdellovibrionales bacterium]
MVIKTRFVLVTFLLMMFSSSTLAALPGDKRTILTSGEKVYTLRFQLGLSTVLDFGTKPEIVICGNKNYFNIEKLKNAITIQPLANYSTNLTVISQGRRYLFYLTPAGNASPDGFVEVKWVNSSDVRAIRPLASESHEITKNIHRKVKLSHDLELTVVREKSMKQGNRRIFEMELKNLSRKTFSTNNLEVVAAFGGVPLKKQVMAWESESLEGKKTLRGRIIVTDMSRKAISLMIGFQRKSTKVLLKSD